MNAIDTEKLRQGLLEDLSYARQTADKTQQASKAPEDSSFAPRALRMQNKAIGEVEIAKLQKMIGKASNDLVYESGLIDELEQSKFKSDFTKRMNQVKLQFLRAAGEMDVHMKKKGLDQAKQQAIWAAFAQTVSGATEGIVSNMGKKPDPTIDKINLENINPKTTSMGGRPLKPGGGYDFGLHNYGYDFGLNS